MKKEEIYRLLRERGIWHEITEHPAVYSLAESAAVPLPYPQADSKSLFVRDGKKRCYYLITVQGDRRVDLKAFRQRHGTASLSFATPEELAQLLGLYPGAVTPLGLLNDKEHRVALYLDKAFLVQPGLIGIHPNDNTATVWMKAEDLAQLLTAHGCTVYFTE